MGDARASMGEGDDDSSELQLHTVAGCRNKERPAKFPESASATRGMDKTGASQPRDLGASEERPEWKVGMRGWAIDYHSKWGMRENRVFRHDGPVIRMEYRHLFCESSCSTV
jgi:hypothetical protein